MRLVRFVIFQTRWLKSDLHQLTLIHAEVFSIVHVPVQLSRYTCLHMISHLSAMPLSLVLPHVAATSPFPGSLWSARLWRSEGPLLETFPSIKTPCEQTLRGPSPINAAQDCQGPNCRRYSC